MQSRVDLASAIPLPPDVRRLIGLVGDMSVRDILNWCQTEKRTQQAICNNISFWKGLAKERLGLTLDDQDPGYIQLVLSVYEKIEPDSQLPDPEDREAMFMYIGENYIDVYKSPSLESADANIIVRAAINADNNVGDVPPSRLDSIADYVAGYFPLMSEDDLVTLALDLADGLESYVPARDVFEIASELVSEKGRKRLFYGAILAFAEHGEEQEGNLTGIIEMMADRVPQGDRENALVWLEQENVDYLDADVVLILWDMASASVKQEFLKRLEEHVRNGDMSKYRAKGIRETVGVGEEGSDAENVQGDIVSDTEDELEED